MNKNGDTFLEHQVWGHRGCRGPRYPPENSLSAFQKAIHCGVGGIELDVHLTADHELIVFHDDSVSRMTGIPGEVSALTLSQCKNLRLIDTECKRSEESIPTLEEVFALVERLHPPKPFTVNIELKGKGCAAAVANAVRRRITQGSNAEDFLISSFDLRALGEVRALFPALPIGALFECAVSDLPQRMGEIVDLPVATIIIPFPSLDSSALRFIHAAGAKAAVWTPGETNPNGFSRAQRAQLRKRLCEREFVMITDFPEEVIQLLQAP